MRRINVNLRDQQITEEEFSVDAETGVEVTADPQQPEPELAEPASEQVAVEPEPGSQPSGTVLSYADLEPIELPRGTKTRIEANLTALETAQRVETDHRYADAGELRELAVYTGWGGLGDIFDESDSSYERARQRLRASVSDQAYHTLRASILNAHYTPPPLAEAIWEPLREASAGGEPLRVLEPGSGTGIFFRASGLAGSDTPHQFVGVEVDETTARISALLHPEAEIHHAGFEQTRMDEDSFDLAIGNVPFGDWALPDPRHNTAGLSIHNHFIHKALAHTAPGGYAAIITSRYTLDAKSSTAREVLARKADLVGAVRLPEGAQSELSGTQIGTDVLIFRRRAPETPASEATQQWVQTTTRTVTDKNGVPHEVDFNGYFAANPQRVIGTVEHSTNPFGPGYQVSNRDGLNVADHVRAHITDITTTPGQEFNPARTVAPDFKPGIQTVPVAEARYGHVRYNSESQAFEEYAASMRWQPLKKNLQPAKKDRNQTLRLLAIRDAARELIEAQRETSDTGTREELRGRLRGQWEAYTEAFGPINKRSEVKKAPKKPERQQIKRELARQWVGENLPEIEVQELDIETLDRLIAGDEETQVPEAVLEQWEETATAERLSGYSQPHLNPLRNDPSLGLLVAVEDIDYTTGEARPAAIMDRDVLARIATATSAETAEEAVSISMAERGHVDAARIAELLGTSDEQTVHALEGLVFTNPETEQMETAAGYLSGNVREKLDQAHAAAEAEPTFQANVAALQAVVPETIQLDEVTINPGVPWLDRTLYETFAAETFGTAVEVAYDAHGANGKWNVQSPETKVGEDVLYRWGTAHRNVSPWTVLEKTLNSQVFKLTKEDPEDPEKRVPDPRGTDAANDKIDQLKEEFRTWVKADPQRAVHVQDRYNRLFNSIVPSDYSSLAESLDFPGLAADRHPYAYQRAAVARALNEPAVLLDHVVGAGKTGSMIMTAMEKRRLGHANKPALVVPGHLVGQISSEWKQWYPNAETMAIPGGLVADERREMFARAAAGQWDGVVLADTVFEEVSIDPSRHQAMMQTDIDDVRAAADELRAEGASRAAIKKAEKSVKTLESQYQKLADKPDTGLVFEETGIDFLMVDEAHHYKNLGRTSDVPELDHSAGSQRARNLDYILCAMREDKISRAKAEGSWTPGYVPSVVLFSTGTPVANKVSEMWVMQRYLRPDLLAERQISDVNAWGATFTEQDWRVIATPDGRYQRALKVTGFANVPEMLAFNRSFQDSVTRGDLEVPLPRVNGSERQLQILEPTEEVEEFMVDLQVRVDEIKRGNVDQSEDNVLKIVHEGRMAALDPRLMGMEAPGDGGRAAAIADQISRIHEASRQNTYTSDTGEPSEVTGGLQIVFADLSTPKPQDPGRFTIYDDLKSQLVDRGIPAEKIAFIHDAAKDADKVELFRKARDGDINVLVGSTQKMGTGMNVQRRAVALHHVDPPWRPADVEQREGRIIRQGNQNQQVEVLAYGTAATTDTFMWSKLSQKVAFIEQLKNPTGVGRTMEDPLGGLDATAANAQAVLSGDPRIGDLLSLESEISSLERLHHSHAGAQARARVSISNHQSAAERYQQQLPHLRELATQVTDTRGDAFAFTTAEGTVITSRDEAAATIAAQVRRSAFIPDQQDLQPTDHKALGQLGGVPLRMHRHLGRVHITTPVEDHKITILAELVRQDNKSPEGLLRQVQHLVASTEETITKWENAAQNHVDEAANLTETMSKGWGRAEELETKRREYEELKAEMGYTDDDESLDAEPAALTANELGELMPDGLRLEHGSEVRDGDVLRVSGGPQGSGYYLARWKTEEPEARPSLMVWPEDSTEELAEPLGFHPFMDNKVHLAARQRSSLSAIETCQVQGREDPSVRRIRGYQVEEGMQVVVGRSDRDELVEGTISREGREQTLVPTDGGEPMVLYGAGLAAGRGILQLDYQPPEQHQATQSTGIPAYTLGYGVQLTEDVEGLGKTGDLLVRRINQYGGGALASLDPQTGVAAMAQGRMVRLEPHQYREPVMISQEDKRKLGAPNIALVEETQAAHLRPGDHVPMRDLDKKHGRGEPVTVTSNNTGIYSQKSTINYRTAEGQQRNVEIPKSQQVRVQERARASLTVTELAKLRIGVIIDQQGTPTPGAKSVTAESLVNSLGEYGVENPDVLISYTEGQSHRMVAGRLAAAEQLSDVRIGLQLVTSDDTRTITADPTTTEVTITAEPIEVAELNISGTHGAQGQEQRQGEEPPVAPADMHRPSGSHQVDLAHQVAVEQQSAGAANQAATVGLN